MLRCAESGSRVGVLCLFAREPDMNDKVWAEALVGFRMQAYGLLKG